MTAKPGKSKGGRVVEVKGKAGESEVDTMTRAFVGPFLRHGVVAKGVTDKMASKLPGDPQFDDFAVAIKRMAEGSKGEVQALAQQMLAAQALSLDAIFTEFARRSLLNVGDYVNASERYMRLALKAQAGSRATLAELAKLHQPREQTVRHVHVNEGGQAVIADQFHHHTGGQENGQTGEQPHAKGAPGPALSGPDPIGQAVPIPGGEGQAAVPDARGKGSGAPSGNRNAWKHGARSAETRLVQAMIRALQDERDGEV